MGYRFFLAALLSSAPLFADFTESRPRPRPQSPTEAFACSWSAGECRNSCADHNCYGVWQPELCKDPGLNWACYYGRP